MKKTGEILRVENLTKIYGEGENAVRALDGVSFSVQKGEFVAVMGASGSGKSTLLHLLGGVDRPTAGKVYVGGVDVYAQKEEELAVFRRRKVGLIYQFYNLIPVLTVEENIALPVLMDGRKVNKERMENLLKILKMEKRRTHLPGQLSGGQQQRVSIARTLVQQADIILADEPVASLDPITTQKIMGDLKQINQTMGKTVIVNIHSVQLAKEFSSRILGFKSGQVVFDGTPEELTGEELTRIYGRNILEEKEGAEHEA